MPETLLGRDSNIDVFMCVKFAKFLRTTILKNICEKPATLLRRDLQDEICKIFRKTYSEEPLRTTALHFLCIA